MNGNGIMCVRVVYKLVLYTANRNAMHLFSLPPQARVGGFLSGHDELR